MDKAAITSNFRLGRYEVLRSLRHYLRAQNGGHDTVDRLEERGVERGSARWSSLDRGERGIVKQTNIGTGSKTTLGKLLRDGWVHIGFPEHRDTILYWTGLNRPRVYIYVFWFFLRFAVTAINPKLMCHHGVFKNTDTHKKLNWSVPVHRYLSVLRIPFYRSEYSFACFTHCPEDFLSDFCSS